MKKLIVITKFISNAINALIGVLAAIGFLEIINVIISICIGQYVRMDGGNLEEVLENYITFGLYGYAMAWIFIYCNKISKDENKDIVQKTKKVIIVTWVILLIVDFIYGILLSDFRGALYLNVMYSCMFGLVLLVLYVCDKKEIKEINDKIKENKEKKD